MHKNDIYPLEHEGLRWRFFGSRPISELADMVTIQSGMDPQGAGQFNGEICDWCDEPIVGTGFSCPHFGTRGKTVSYLHLECLIRSTAGSVGHQLRLCHCYGGDPTKDIDDPALTRRQAAVQAYKLFMNIE